MPSLKLLPSVFLALFATAIILLCVLNPFPSFGLKIGDPLSCRFVYPFQHASIWHVLTNIWCLAFYVFSPLKLGFSRYCLAYLSSVSVPSFLLSSVPVVGMSGCCFFIIGSVSLIVTNKWRFMIMTIALLVLGLPFSSCSVSIHLWGWFCGMLYSLLTTPFIKLHWDGFSA